MKWFLYLLLAYLSPFIEDETPEDEPADADDGEDEADPEDDETPEVPEDDDEPAPEPRISRAQKAIITARERAQTAERELAQARAELAVSRRAPAQPAQPTQDQLIWQQEEETLRNPEATDWQKYAINANRNARAAQAASQTALQRAEDMADKTAFAALAATKPKLYTAYKDRVEDKLKEARAAGANPSRENILRFMVGEDMLNGKLKSVDTKAAKPAAASRANVRSDVSSSGGGRLSDHEKREKRLENIRI